MCVVLVAGIAVEVGKNEIDFWDDKLQLSKQSRARAEMVLNMDGYSKLQKQTSED